MSSNVRIRYSAQSPTLGVVQTDDLDTATNAFSRYIIQDVATRQARNAKQGFANVLAGQIEADIMDVVQSMASRISRGIAVAEQYRSPQATLSVRGRASTMSMALGWMAPFHTSDTNPSADWADRSDEYMKWKRHKGITDWFKVTGSLQDFLSDAGVYTKAFGPIVVHFYPAKDPATLSDPIFARQRKTPTHYAVKVGRVEVICFGNITKEMLPSLASGNPADIGSGPGVASLFETVAPDQWAKLMNREGKQRRVLDPFVSFYLTRAIPDAIMRRVSTRLQQIGQAPTPHSGQFANSFDRAFEAEMKRRGFD